MHCESGEAGCHSLSTKEVVKLPEKKSYLFHIRKRKKSTITNSNLSYFSVCMHEQEFLYSIYSQNKETTKCGKQSDLCSTFKKLFPDLSLLGVILFCCFYTPHRGIPGGRDSTLVTIQSLLASSWT